MAKTVIDTKNKTVNKAGLNKYFNFTRDEKISYILLFGTLFLVWLIRSNFYDIGFERDEGAYSLYGKLLLEGKIPYKDFYEQKFPGIFYFYAFMVAIFGDTVRGMHIGFMLLNMLTVVFLFFASKRLFSNMAAVVTAVTYAVVSLTPNLSGFTIQGEHGVAFFVSLGILFYSFTVQNPSFKNYLLMGIAMGCAFMVKTSGMFLVLWGGIAIVSDQLFNKGKIDFKKVIRAGLIYSAGVFFVIGVLFLIIALKGSFEDMFYWAYKIPKKYVGKIKWEDGKKYLDYAFKSITADYKFFWLHAGLALIVIILKNINIKTKIMSVTLIGLSTATIFPGYYFYGHYWIQILPGLSILAGLTCFTVLDIFKNRMGIRSNNLPYIYIGVFVIATLMHINKLDDYYFNPNYERILRTVYGNNPFPECVKIADYINANSKPEDKIAVMGSEPQLYFYTHKNASSRHNFFSAIVENVPEHHEWQREFVRGIEKDKPRYFIFFNHQISLFVQPGADQYVFQWYDKYVREHYNLIGCVDMVDGYTSTYVWKEQLATFKPQGQSQIYIFERKET